MNDLARSRMGIVYADSAFYGFADASIHNIADFHDARSTIVQTRFMKDGSDSNPRSIARIMYNACDSGLQSGCAAWFHDCQFPSKADEQNGSYIGEAQVCFRLAFFGVCA